VTFVLDFWFGFGYEKDWGIAPVLIGRLFRDRWLKKCALNQGSNYGLALVAGTMKPKTND
jgi:hypothetical protein